MGRGGCRIGAEVLVMSTGRRPRSVSATKSTVSFFKNNKSTTFPTRARSSKRFGQTRLGAEDRATQTKTVPPIRKLLRTPRAIAERQQKQKKTIAGTAARAQDRPIPRGNEEEERNEGFADSR